MSSINNNNDKIPANFHDYVFGAVDDRDRLVVQHEVFKPSFLQILERVIGEYGLAERISNAVSTQEQVRTLDVGCGEGLYMHDIADWLESRKLLKAVDLNGLDKDALAITTAEEFSRSSKPSRPYLNFYVWDATHPIENCTALRQEGKLKFDFIYSIHVVEFFPDAQSHVKRLYEYLKPGGVIYIREGAIKEGEGGWYMPNPALASLFGSFRRYIAQINSGLEVAREHAHWLKEAGAEDVSNDSEEVPVGGKTKQGLDFMRDIVMLCRNAGPRLVSNGVISQIDFNNALETLFKELRPEPSGYVNFVHTIARKPLE